MTNSNSAPQKSTLAASDEVQIGAFYHFGPIAAAELESLAEQLDTLGEKGGLRGLIILATEGINGTVSGPTRESVINFLGDVSKLFGFPELSPKWSTAPSLPFRRFRVRLRDEIVTLGKPEVQPLAPKSATHLSPEDWDKMMENPDNLVLDTRNWYETQVGKFKNAVDPKIDDFQDFSEYLQKAEIPKEKNVMIYCTGGIRCEKAIVEMHNQGFQNVFQLDGGILNYLAQKPNEKFEGECFVFDHRVAVDQNLRPSATYRLCPHCGQPGTLKLDCLRCDTPSVICQTCADVGDEMRTCSKNCSNHYKTKPGQKGRAQALNYKFEA